MSKLFVIAVIIIIIVFICNYDSLKQKFENNVVADLEQSTSASEPKEESDLPVILTLLAISSGLGALWRRSASAGATCLVCCIILLFIDYNWVLLILLIIFVLIPMGLVAIVSSLFKRD